MDLTISDFSCIAATGRAQMTALGGAVAVPATGGGWAQTQRAPPCHPDVDDIVRRASEDSPADISLAVISRARAPLDRETRNSEHPDPQSRQCTWAARRPCP